MHVIWRRLRLFALISAFALSAVSTAHAAPWSRLNLFSQVEADPNATYGLTEENGPWMILAVTFSSQTAEQDARELAYELRKRYKLLAYSHKMHFDFTGEVQGKGVSPDGSPKRMRYRRNSEYDEVAVLVGNFPSVDDPEAQALLKKIKMMRPHCLSDDSGPDSRPLAGFREMQRIAQEIIGDEKHERGPMGHAFITTNPLLPNEYFVPEGLDDLVVELNEGIEFSLLDCPGEISVQIAMFKGNTTVDPTRIAAIENGGKTFESRLQQAAEKAHRLTLALRERNWEAYEFHDRHASMVTIGSFDSVGMPRADGKIEINPAIHKIMQTFGAEQPAPGVAAAGVGQPKVVDGITLDIQPLPVRVPRRPVTGGANARLAGGLR